MIGIIGAGPVGNYAAYQLAKEGFDVGVYEEHDLIGKPVQCTGITTLYLADVIDVDETFLVNTINSTRVYGPSGEHVEIPLKENYIVDRTKFDQYLAEQAKNEGARYYGGHRFLHAGMQNKEVEAIFNKSDGTTAHKHFERLIGADGPGSMVARSFGIYGNRKFAVGIQARMKMDSKIKDNIVDFYLGDGYFGWVVPENKEIARVGIASIKNAKQFFDKFTEGRRGKVLEWQSGVIPVYDPRLRSSFGNDKVMLVGDAAAMVKATTYGGIIPGMMGAEEVARAIVRGRSYERLWKKRIGKELLLHLLIRKMLDRMNDKQLDLLVKLVKQERVKNVISRHDREFPSKLAVEILVKEPRFLRFALPLLGI